ncbi:hypothetical protein HZS_3411 [Henneguya salminicola]|nr:hypothetical protein HZS_3411 [Henneguya salminicola]
MLGFFYSKIRFILHDIRLSKLTSAHAQSKIHGELVDVFSSLFKWNKIKTLRRNIHILFALFDYGSGKSTRQRFLSEA